MYETFLTKMFQKNIVCFFAFLYDFLFEQLDLFLFSGQNCVKQTKTQVLFLQKSVVKNFLLNLEPPWE